MSESIPYIVIPSRHDVSVDLVDKNGCLILVKHLDKYIFVNGIRVLLLTEKGLNILKHEIDEVIANETDIFI